jgi:acid stress chaperone HdeB
LILGRATTVKFTILVSAFLCVAGASQAQQVDISHLKCKEFIDLPKETIANIILWLDGYYTDEEDPAVVDFDKMKLKAEKLVALCAQNPKLRVMTAAEDIVLIK